MLTHTLRFSTLKFRPEPRSAPSAKPQTPGLGADLCALKHHRAPTLRPELRSPPPQQRHKGVTDQVLAKRKEALEAANAKPSSQWSSDSRDFSLPETVALNPERRPTVKEPLNRTRQSC